MRKKVHNLFRLLGRAEQASHIRFYVLNLVDLKFYQYQRDPKTKVNSKMKEFDARDLVKVKAITKVETPYLEKNWGHGFKVVFAGKDLDLYCYGPKERDVWIGAFYKLIKLLKKKYPHNEIDENIYFDNGQVFPVQLSPASSPVRQERPKMDLPEDTYQLKIAQDHKSNNASYKRQQRLKEL